MTPKAVKESHIAQDKGICGGCPRIAGTRIKVQQIILEYERLGWTPDQICEAHPSIGLADIHAALMYYYDHKKEIDRDIQNDEEFAARLKESLAE